MANRIKGITVKIGGDTTKLQTALKGVNGEIKNTHDGHLDFLFKSGIQIEIKGIIGDITMTGTL